MVDLRIYIAGHCPVSDYAIELAQEVTQAFPLMDVSVFDVEQFKGGLQEAQDEVLLTPCYFLDGRPIYWGNPAREDLFQIIDRVTSDAMTGGMQ